MRLLYLLSLHIKIVNITEAEGFYHRLGFTEEYILPQ